MNENDNESLNYVSSVDAFAPEKTAPSVDVADEKALIRVQKALASEIKLYHTISGMKRFPSVFNADQREAMCNHYVELLTSLTQKVNNAIDGIKSTRGDIK